MEYDKLSLTCILTDRCRGRNCAFCGTDAKAKGDDLSAKNARLFLEQLEDFNGLFRVCITGGGEPLLSKNFYPMVHNLFRIRKFAGLSIVTSGATPEEEKEWNRLRSVFDASFAKYITPTLSFHEYGTGFDGRFIETLKYLITQTVVKRIHVKLIHGYEIGRTYLKFFDVLNRVLHAICEQKNSDNYAITHLKFAYNKEFNEFLRSSWLQERIKKYSRANAEAIAVTSLLFECEYAFFEEGKKEEAIIISVKPQKISGAFGRGRYFEGALQKVPCPVFENVHPWRSEGAAKISLQSDGYFYPVCSCSCPKRSVTHLGSVSEGTLEEKIKQGDVFFELMQARMNSRKEEFKGKYPCDICIEEWTKMLQS